MISRPSTFVFLLAASWSAQSPGTDTSIRTAAALPYPETFLVVPNATNAVQFRLYTNASPEASHLFNTFEIVAFGESLLPGPESDKTKKGLAQNSSDGLHNLLVNGAGPDLATTNNACEIERSSGPGWCYVGLDFSPAYRGRLTQYKRGVLFVEPDLFILCDHLVAPQPSLFEMRLHPPTAARLDPVWGDLLLNTPQASLKIHAPGARKKPRNWQRVDSAGDPIVPETLTMRLGPTNQLEQLDLLTVFAVHPRAETREYAFKLLESDSAVGARIHRNGLPTLVAFKTHATAGHANLVGFEFAGPAGVSVFVPKNRR